MYTCYISNEMIIINSEHLRDNYSAQIVFKQYLLLPFFHTHSQLKDAVCSPAGASIQAIQVLEKAGYRGLMMEAVQAASKRASELSRIENGEKQDYSLKRR